MRKWCRYLMFLKAFPLTAHSAFSFRWLHDRGVVQLDESLSSFFGLSSSFSYIQQYPLWLKFSTSYSFILQSFASLFCNLSSYASRRFTNLVLPFFVLIFILDLEKESTQRRSKCITTSKSFGTEAFPRVGWSDALIFRNLEQCEN